MLKSFSKSLKKISVLNHNAKYWSWRKKTGMSDFCIILISFFQVSFLEYNLGVRGFEDVQNPFALHCVDERR